MHRPIHIRLLPIGIGLLLLMVSGCSPEPSSPAAGTQAPSAAAPSPPRPSPREEPHAPVATAAEQPAQANVHTHEHEHEASTGDLVAPAGGWASDAPLRRGMQAILDAVVAAVRAQGEGPALAAELRAQIDFLFANCRLQPEADAALHGILAELLLSAQRLEAGASPAEEHYALHASLQRYGQLFQHPGWPLR